MTDPQRKLHRGKLLVDIEDAENALAYSSDALLCKAEFLEEIAEKLRSNARLQPSPFDFTPEADIENRLTPEEVADFPTSQSIGRQIEELKKSRQVLFNLRKRKESLPA